MPFGISDENFNKIVAVFCTLKKINRVIIFGSRALGRYRSGSDIDIALEGENLTLNDILEIRLMLDNLMLPYRFDLVTLDQNTNSDLLDHINRVGIEIYSQ